MKYFIKDKDRKGTCYYEFYKGKWDGESFWKTDSILLQDDIVFQNEEFIDAILEVVPSYNPFGETEISNVEWKAIGQFIELKTLLFEKSILKRMNGFKKYLKNMTVLQY